MARGRRGAVSRSAGRHRPKPAGKEDPGIELQAAQKAQNNACPAAGTIPVDGRAVEVAAQPTNPDSGMPGPRLLWLHPRRRDRVEPLQGETGDRFEPCHQPAFERGPKRLLLVAADRGIGRQGSEAIVFPDPRLQVIVMQRYRPIRMRLNGCLMIGIQLAASRPLRPASRRVRRPNTPTGH